MAADPSSDGIESAPSPAVSSLRSRFEKLAADSSAAPTTPSASLKPSGSVHHLAAVPPSPRLKPLLHPDPDHPSLEPRSPLLRPASSASDLKAATKRPPPPPPGRPSSRAPSPANVRVSPLVRPVPDSSSGSTPEHEPLSEPASVVAKPSSAIRRPPPPPPPGHDHPAAKNPAVSSIIKQFG
ncbi:hypothetical protein FKP32DRAFT_1181093 [Trametes sanguinea]|nr:hypothetical protein FKP32DRAFT_1181093 [Trametes sanguinea]